MSSFSMFDVVNCAGYTFEDYNNAPDHRKLSQRLRKTFYYGRSPATDRPSYPMTRIAVEFFQEAAPRELGKLDESYSAFVSRRACMSPCSMMLAMLYIKRLKKYNMDYLNQMSSSDLFFISMMMASKYLYDEGVDDEVFNDEWAESAQMDLTEVDNLERGFLSAIDWRLFVRPHEFQETVIEMEKRIALDQGLERGWFTYTDMMVLTTDLNWASFGYDIYHELWKVMVACSVAYMASIITVVGSTALVLSLHGVMDLVVKQTSRSAVPLSDGDSSLLQADPNLLMEETLSDILSMDLHHDNSNLDLGSFVHQDFPQRKEKSLAYDNDLFPIKCFRGNNDIKCHRLQLYHKYFLMDSNLLCNSTTEHTTIESLINSNIAACQKQKGDFCFSCRWLSYHADRPWIGVPRSRIRQVHKFTEPAKFVQFVLQV